MAKKKKTKVIQMLSPVQYIRQKARTLPIHECWINVGWEDGLANITVARKHTNGNLTLGLYLVDLKCLGVKDSHYFFNISPGEYNELLLHTKESMDIEPADYTLVHNIIFAGIEFAEDFGFKPHHDFSVSQYILEEDTEDIEWMEIECGHNGQPFYVKGPLESDLRAGQIIAQLEKTAGPGNYGFVNALDEDPFVDDDDFDDDDVDVDFDEFIDPWEPGMEFPEGMPEYNENEVKNSETFQFKIQLQDINNPTVWRKVTVPSYYSFLHFHYIIQMVFGWENYHLFQFSEKEYNSKVVISEIEENADTFGENQLEAAEISLSEIFRTEKQQFIYLYDFGDSWEHLITLEKIISETTTSPRLLAGQGACPPEDCGGVGGFENMKDILKNKKHPEYRKLRKWLDLDTGEIWNSNAFDLEEKQEQLQQFFNGK